MLGARLERRRSWRRRSACVVGGGVLQQAEAVEHLQRRQHLGVRRRIAAPVAVARRPSAVRRRRAEAGDAAQHLHEQSRQRQVRPVRVGGDVEEDELAVAALARR